MKRQKKQSNERVSVGYDYSTREMREETADAPLRRAKNARTVVEIEWERWQPLADGEGCGSASEAK